MKEYDIVKEYIVDGTKMNENADKNTQQIMQEELAASHEAELDNLSTKNCFVFDKVTTSYIKGIAIVMMIVHHFFAFPEWQMKENMYISVCLIYGTPIELYIGQLCKLCVCIFAFISGYGVFVSLDKKDMASKFRYCLKKVIGLLFMYWMAIVLFVAPIFFYFKKTSLELLISNLLLYDYSMIYTGWYVLFYIEMLIFVFFYSSIKLQKNEIWDFIIIFGLSFISNSFIPNNPLSHYFLSFMIGYMFSKYSLYSGYERVFNNTIFRNAISFLLLITVFIVRIVFGEMIVKIPMVSFIAPIICYNFAIIVRFIIKNGLIKSTLSFLSKYSTWYWFLHVVFHSKIYSIQLLGYLPKYSVLIVIWVFALLMPFVIILDFLYNKVFKRKNSFLS